MIHQLDPPLPVHVMGSGNAVAHLVIDYGPEYDLLWVCILDRDGEIWTVPNPDVRGRWNQTLGREARKDIP